MNKPRALVVTKSQLPVLKASRLNATEVCRVGTDALVDVRVFAQRGYLLASEADVWWRARNAQGASGGSGDGGRRASPGGDCLVLRVWV